MNPELPTPTVGERFDDRPYLLIEDNLSGAEIARYPASSPEDRRGLTRIALDYHGTGINIWLVETSGNAIVRNELVGHSDAHGTKWVSSQLS